MVLIKNKKANFQSKFSCFPKPLLFCKKGELTYEVIVQVILITLVFVMFFLAATSRVHSKVVKQQVLEKQIALLIDSAEPEMVFRIWKNYNRGGIVRGTVTKLEIKEGRIFVYVNGQGFSQGYPYFTRYDVSLQEEEDKYLISVR